SGPTAAAARDLARGSALALVQANEANGNQVKLVSPASLPESPLSPRPKRDALLAFLVALVVNAELAAVLSRLFDRIDTRHHRTTGAQTEPRVITYLPRHKAREAT